ncbi:unnamed protein product [Clonostachys chloroleuca]|uniref:MADS-box domain-containing protein n=1 Tax=Clonostachys chloroleuca TaxID=1926264 RepID=A0AA35Q395_9HYPO|nr:unnamed protein product [Clonostachys chloroleuca]
MARLRREKNKDARKGRKNRETGIIKKLNTLVRLYDGEAVLFIRRPSGHYRGYQSRKGLVAMLPDVIDEAKLQGPDDFPTPGRDEGDDERMESIEEQGEQEDQDQDLPDCFDSENSVWMDPPHEPEQVPLELPLQVNNISDIAFSRALFLAHASKEYYYVSARLCCLPSANVFLGRSLFIFK